MLYLSSRRLFDSPNPRVGEGSARSGNGKVIPIRELRESRVDHVDPTARGILSIVTSIAGQWPAKGALVL